MTLGQHICQYRKQLNISQEELGDRLGVSRQAVSKWETDLSAPDMNNLLALAREFGISVAELTETPEKTDTDEADSVPPLPIQAPAKGRSTWKKVLIAIFVLFILFLAGFLLNPRNTEQFTAGTAEETTNIADLVKSPTTDFALVLDWTETGDFLQLGEQTGTYPFETPLPQDAKMVVTKEDNGAELHTVDCLDEAGIRLTYSHLDGQPDTILKLETDYKELSTPRGIHVGSTKAEVVGAYGTDLVYCVKEDGSNLLAAHNYFYAYQPKDAYSNSICFFMEDGLVAGIRVENMLDAGNEAYSVNNITRFPIQSSGDPDYSNRQDIYQEPIDTTRRVYIAWNQLVTNENLSAEEQYAYRRDVFTNLPDMDWQEFGELGSTIDNFTTSEAFMSWLAGQESYSDSEILRIQWGCTAKGLDGAYSESYDEILCSALFYDPVTYAKMLAYPNVMDDKTRWHAITGAVFYGELFPEKEADAAETLDAVIDTNALTAEENAWAKLLRYYLATPSKDGGFGDYPKTPAELESLQNG